MTKEHCIPACAWQGDTNARRAFDAMRGDRDQMRPESRELATEQIRMNGRNFAYGKRKPAGGSVRDPAEQGGALEK
jgi:hypothetical protein